MLTVASRADFEAALAEYLAWRAAFCGTDGELLPKFQPAPMTPSFLGGPADAGAPDEADAGEPAGLARTSIPVPRGPVEVW